MLLCPAASASTVPRGLVKAVGRASSAAGYHARRRNCTAGRPAWRLHPWRQTAKQGSTSVVHLFRSAHSRISSWHRLKLPVQCCPCHAAGRLGPQRAPGLPAADGSQIRQHDISSTCASLTAVVGRRSRRAWLISHSLAIDHVCQQAVLQIKCNVSLSSIRHAVT